MQHPRAHLIQKCLSALAACSGSPGISGSLSLIWRVCDESGCRILDLFPLFSGGSVFFTSKSCVFNLSFIRRAWVMALEKRFSPHADKNDCLRFIENIVFGDLRAYFTLGVFCARLSANPRTFFAAILSAVEFVVRLSNSGVGLLRSPVRYLASFLSRTPTISPMTSSVNSNAS